MKKSTHCVSIAKVKICKAVPMPQLTDRTFLDVTGGAVNWSSASKINWMLHHDEKK